jgi:methionyl-tRNA formyltransferase
MMGIAPNHRVVVICSDAWRHRYFANRLCQAFNVVGIVNERTRPHVGLGFVRRYWELARGFHFNPLAMAEKAACVLIEQWRGRGVYERILGPAGAHLQVPPGAQHLRIESSVNLPENVEQIRALRPDVIAVSGTRLLSRAIIEIPTKAAINMHGGLSPYYRGGESVFWALYNHEPQYVGVTVHLLTLGIDAGPLLYTARPRMEAADNEMTLFAKTYRLGCELMIYAIEDALAGQLNPVPQWEKGRLYRRKDRKTRHYRALIRTLNAGLLAEYLRRPEDGTAVRLVGDPRRLAAAQRA